MDRLKTLDRSVAHPIFYNCRSGYGGGGRLSIYVLRLKYIFMSVFVLKVKNCAVVHNDFVVKRCFYAVCIHFWFGKIDGIK